jgi:fimbrial isopeptide formation D2 family protein/LPXTG-motif cell wall-anchored protein
MVFADKTTDGLTFDGASSITVKIGNNTLAEADYTISTDTEDFTVTINMLKNTGTDAAPVYEAKYTYNDPITVTYTAKVNKDAVTKIDENHATLTYNHNPKDDTEVGTTPPVVVKTYSSKLQIEKVDGSDTSTKLSGAVFVLRSKTPNTNTGETVTAQAGKYYKFTAASGDTPAKTEWITVNPDAITDLITAANNNTITSVTTDENGAASFDGLEDGTYELIEIISPEGYNLVTTPTEVTIAGSDSDDTKLTVTSQVKNNSGSVLPSTGGIGTTIFYVLGAILVIGAGVVLVSRRRMNIQ